MSPPTLEAPSEELRRAIDLARHGDWQAAHGIVQSYEGDSIASWIHAVVHRMEGDLTNARYWYHRGGRALREDVAVTDELEQIAAALAER